MSTTTKASNSPQIHSRGALVLKLERLALAMGQVHEQMVDDKRFHFADMVAVSVVEAAARAAVTILKKPEATL